MATQYNIPKVAESVRIYEDELGMIAELFRDGWEQVLYSSDDWWSGPKALAKVESVMGTFIVSYIPRQNTAALLAGNTGLKGDREYETDLLVSVHDKVNNMSKAEIVTWLATLLAKQQREKWEEMQRIAEEKGQIWN